MDLARDFAATQQEIQNALVNTIRAATRVSAEDIAFHRSSSVGVARSLDSQNERLLALTQKLMRGAIAHPLTDLTSLESIDGNWSSITDAIDSLLERCDTCLDEFKGRFRQADSVMQSERSTNLRPPRKALVSRTEEIAKPQLQFQVLPDNFATPPFRPWLATKPHAQIPLENSLQIREASDGLKQTQHPYEAEINDYSYPPSIYHTAEPMLYKSFEKTQATFVDTFDGVLEMLEELKTAREIAVDLEHHDAHSYIGLVSLMQISTRDHDWIVDTLKPWRHKLSVLNEVFADPGIIKVLHGAHMDIVWLQRDLGLYVVGLFDTHHASRVLGYPGGSLAYLLKRFVDFDAQKQYQTADWRLRPLPTEMFDYARSDTHFLLYVFDCMRNDLIKGSQLGVEGGELLGDVLARSKETALQLYEHPHYDEDRGLGRGGWFNLIQRNMAPMSREQFAVFRKVHQWRDLVARQDDEGIPFIMPNHVLFNISRALPRDMPSLLNLSHPISRSMRLRLDELLQLVRDTVSNSAHEPDLAEKLTQILQFKPALARKNGMSLPAIMSNEVPKSEAGETGHAVLLDSSLDSSIRSVSSAFWGIGAQMTQLRRAADDVTRAALGSISLPVPLLGAALLAPFSPCHPDTTESVKGFAFSAAGISASREDAAAPHLPEIQANSVMSDMSPSHDNAQASSAGVVSKATREELDARLELKRARKAARKEARAAKSHNNAADGLNDPFDYRVASSVLHGSPRVSQNTTGRPFNPYAKAAEAPAGVRQKQSSQTTRSSTFKP